GQFIRAFERELGARPAHGVEGRLQHAHEIVELDLAPDDGRRADEGMSAVHELGSGARAVLDLGQALAGFLVELLVVHQQTQVTVEKGQDIVHSMREAANELILEFRMFELHGTDMKKHAPCSRPEVFQVSRSEIYEMGGGQWRSL